MNSEDFQQMVLSDLKEIRKELGRTCIELTEQKEVLSNHLESTKNKAKSKKEKIQNIVTGASLLIASIAIIANFY